MKKHKKGFFNFLIRYFFFKKDTRASLKLALSWVLCNFFCFSSSFLVLVCCTNCIFNLHIFIPSFIFITISRAFECVYSPNFFTSKSNFLVFFFEIIFFFSLSSSARSPFESVKSIKKGIYVDRKESQHVDEKIVAIGQ